MFGPNYNCDYRIHIADHHRSNSFCSIYDSTVSRFREKFNISKNKEVLILSGSGTQSIAVLFNSMNNPLSIRGINGFFKQRLETLSYQRKEDLSLPVITCKVQYETSASKLNDVNGIHFVDAVSSFPYYDIPDSTPVWLTVSSKLLGGLPVISILVIDREFLFENITNRGDLLGLWNVYVNSKKGQTPFTPQMGALIDLNNRLEKFSISSLRNSIKNTCEFINNHVSSDFIIGEKVAPSIIIHRSYFDEKAIKMFNLYPSKIKDYVQVFTYSEDFSAYEHLFVKKGKIFA
ncbi:hypothetical protein [Vibrio nigripulchritudo]|uniref:Uncharacterized protein n=2 Tax=Vibrio nigripulchritudo TaxID=28173 RepID=A0A9P1NJG1_9VIBR|nr:hypothetical protein [Vibrio nigripulchritudo]CBJ93124.1 Protein of unknown function [Vibrio nigripulchritudo]CCN97736.1 hypothetical protein VIBNIENn2_p0084 [Vibrio nigripulchritudo ENn2]